VEREEATIGVFITLEEPSQDMVTEAARAGYYRPRAWEGQYPKIQILTIAELLSGTQVQMPPQRRTHKQAERVKEEGPRTQDMFEEQ
jgi:hypothetical protein